MDMDSTPVFKLIMFLNLYKTGIQNSFDQDGIIVVTLTLTVRITDEGKVYQKKREATLKGYDD